MANEIIIPLGEVEHCYTYQCSHCQSRWPIDYKICLKCNRKLSGINFKRFLPPKPTKLNILMLFLGILISQLLKILKFIGCS